MKRLLIILTVLLVLVYVSCDLGKAHSVPKKLTVIFNPNFNEPDGTAVREPVVQELTKNKLTALRKNEFERLGFTFLGWSTDRTGRAGVEQFADEEIVRLTSDLVLYAVWAENDYTILFNAKGGQLSETGKTVKYEEKVILPSPVKSGEFFGGWFKSEDYSADNALPGVVSKLAPRGNVDVYARWIEPSKVRIITYYANFSGATAAPVQQAIEKGSCEKLIPNEFVRTGYVFDRWTDATGTVFYENGAEVVFEDNAALYATWKPITYKVVLNADNGTGDAVILDDVAYDTQDRLPANKFVRKDYRFLGWAKNSHSDTVLYADMAGAGALSTVQGDVVELYAVWEVVGIKSIAVRNVPDAKSFVYGTAPDLDGLKIEVSFVDGHVIEVDENSIDRYGFDSVDAGKNRKLSVWYGGNKIEVSDFEILRKPVKLTWENSIKEFRYNGSMQHPVPELSGVLPGDVCTVTRYSGAGTGVGLYTVSVTELSNSNYALPSENNSCLYKIVPVVINVVKPSTVFVFEYNAGEQQLLTAGSTSYGKMMYSLNNGEWTDSVTDIVGKEVGDYYIRWEVRDADNVNYYFKSDKDKSGLIVVTIVEKIINITAPEANQLVYNGQAQDLITAGYADKPITGFIYTLDSISGSEIPQGIDAGMYSISWEVIYDSEQYTLGGNCAASGTIEVELKPDEVDLVWDNTELIYNGMAQQPSAVIEGGILPGDSCNVLVSILGYNNGAVNASDRYYTAVAGLDNPNYIVSRVTKTQEFKINKKGVTVTWSNLGPFTYSGFPQGPDAHIASGLLEGDDCVVISSGELNAREEPYISVAELGGTKSGNYKIESGLTQEFTINKLGIDITWTDVEFEYDGMYHRPTPDADGLFSYYPHSQCFLYTELKEYKASDEPYTAEVMIVGEQADNYEILSGETCEYRINRKPVDVTWKTNDSYTYNGKPQGPTATISGVLKNDICQVEITGLAPEATGDEGRNAVAVLTGRDASNYRTENGTCMYYIRPKVVYVSWSDTDLVYNGEEQGPVATLHGVMAGDDCTATVLGKQTEASMFLLATACLTGEDKNNYYIAGSDEGTRFNINMREVGIEWDNTKFVYNGQSQLPVARATNIVDGEKVGVSVEGEQVNAGTYTATAYRLTGDDKDNYVMPYPYPQTDFVIEKAPADPMPALKMIPDGTITGLNRNEVYEYYDEDKEEWVSFTGTTELKGTGSIKLRRPAPDDNHTAGPSKVFTYFVGDGVISGGYFSVGPKKKVLFSRGNLYAKYEPVSSNVQYVSGTAPLRVNSLVNGNVPISTGIQWGIIDRPYEFVGLQGNRFDSQSGSYIFDLFGWSGDGSSAAAFGISDKEGVANIDYYGGNFVDWGENKVSGWPMWRTLSYDEWYYLLYERSVSLRKFGFATIEIGVSDAFRTIEGMVILPDNWEVPYGLETFLPRGYTMRNNESYSDNIYNPFTWSLMEMNGAVFLPAAGWRIGSQTNKSADNTGAPYYQGTYWADNVSNEDHVQHFLNFVPKTEQLLYEDNSIWIGKSVRLVTDYVEYDITGN